MIAAVESTTSRRPIAERGQASVLAIAVIAVLVAITVALVGLGAEEVQRGRLQAVADLTALAAARGDAEGVSVANRNGVRLVEVTHDGGGAVTVVVERDGRRATAAATN